LGLLDGGLIVDGRLEVAQGGVGLAEGAADGHAVARERSADGGDGVEGFVGAAAAFGFVALAHHEVFAVFEVVDFVEAAAPDAAGVRDADGADVADEEVHALEHQAAPRVLRVVAALAVAALRARVLGALPGVGALLMVWAVVGAPCRSSAGRLRRSGRRLRARLSRRCCRAADRCRVQSLLPFVEQEAFGKGVALAGRSRITQRLYYRFVRCELQRADDALIAPTADRVHRVDLDPFAKARFVPDQTPQHGPQRVGEGVNTFAV
jgi:hypothetical protein